MTECHNAHDDEGTSIPCDKTRENHRTCSGWSDREGGFIDWPNPSWEPPKTTEKASAAQTVRRLASKFTGAEAGVEGSERASASWTPTQRMLVEAAITQVAESCAEFTTDQIWGALGDRVPKTAGMAAMLRKASAKGLIEATDKYADSRRADRDDHDQGRRLRVWRSRMSVN
jgi:hypothetical protein